MLKVFIIDVYTLLDPPATLSFVTSLVAKKFDILPIILHVPFVMSTSMGESIVAKKVYRICLIMLPNNFSYFELVELDMLDFDVILGIDWLHACFASIDRRTRAVKFNFPNKPVLD